MPWQIGARHPRRADPQTWRSPRVRWLPGWPARRSRGACARCRAGASCCRPSGARRDGLARPPGHRSWALDRLPPPSPEQSARRSTATASAWSAASSRWCCTSPTLDRPRWRTRDAACWPPPAEVFVAAVVMDAGLVPARGRSTTRPGAASGATSRAVRELAAGRPRLALHPHAGTLVETAADIERSSGQGEATGASTRATSRSAGADPVEFARRTPSRIVHVHLKDVDMGAERVRSGGLSLVEATRLGLFRPLGDGDASIDEVVWSARPPRVRALARARTGHDPHRGGAAGGSGSSARCSEEHRLSGHAGSSPQRRRDSQHETTSALRAGRMLVLGWPPSSPRAAMTTTTTGRRAETDDVKLTQGAI